MQKSFLHRKADRRLLDAQTLLCFGGILTTVFSGCIDGSKGKLLLGESDRSSKEQINPGLAEGYSDSHGSSSNGVQSPVGLKLVLLSPHPISEVTAGSLIPIQAQIQDASGNVVQEPSLNSQILVDDVPIAVEPSHQETIIEFNTFRLTASGLHHLRIKAGDLIADWGSVRVLPAPPSQLSLLPCNDESSILLTADGESQTCLLTQVSDEFGNPVSGVEVQLQIPSGGGLGSTAQNTNWVTQPRSQTNENGEAEFILRSSTLAGVYSYSIQTPTYLLSPSISLTFVPGLVSLAQSELTLSSAVLRSGEDITVEFTARDQHGNQLQTGGLSVQLATFSEDSGSQGSLSATQDHNNGSYTTTLTGTRSGTPNTLRVLINGQEMPGLSERSRFQVTPGPPTTLAWAIPPGPTTLTAGSAFSSGTVEARDDFGNLCDSGEIQFSVDSETSPGNIELEGSLNGELTLPINSAGTASIAGKKITRAGTGYLIRATSGSALPSVSSSVITVNAGPAAALAWTTPPREFPLGLGFETLAVSVVDLYENPTSKPTTSRTLQISLVQPTPGSATLSGTVSKSTSSCPASPAPCILSFTGVSLLNGRIDTPYQLRATASTWSSLSGEFFLSQGTGLTFEHAIELSDQGLTGLKGTSGTTVYANTRTSLNTNDYDGTVTYSFEVVAENANSVASTVSLLNSASTAISTLTLPAGLTTPTRIRSPFVPSAGSNNYRVRLSKNTAGTYKVHSARIIIQQSNAYRTKIYIPLLSDLSSFFGTSVNGTPVDTVTGTTYAQGSASDYGIWRKTSSDFTNVIAGAGGATLEVLVASGTTGAGARAALVDRTTGLPVTGAETSAYATTTSPAVIQSAAFDYDSLEENHEFEVKLKSSTATGIAKIFKAGLWIKMSWGAGSKKTSLYTRIARQLLLNSPTFSRQLGARAFAPETHSSLYTSSFECAQNPELNNDAWIRTVSIQTGQDPNLEGTALASSELTLQASAGRSLNRSGFLDYPDSELVPETQSQSSSSTAKISQCWLLQKLSNP